jgi:hypothetical protein
LHCLLLLVLCTSLGAILFVGQSRIAVGVTHIVPVTCNTDGEAVTQAPSGVVGCLHG